MEMTTNMRFKRRSFRNPKDIIVSISVLLQGTTGVFVVQETSVSAVVLTDGFTRFSFPSSSTSFSFTLVLSGGVSLVGLTNFQLQVSELCADGDVLSVQVDYYTSTTVVCIFLNHSMNINSKTLSATVNHYIILFSSDYKVLQLFKLRHKSNLLHW